MRPYHETSYSYLFADRTAGACDIPGIGASLPESDDLHAYWLPGAPTFAVPVRAMWESRRVWDFADFESGARDDRFDRLPDGRWQPRLRPSRRLPADFAADSAADRAVWFYTTNALYNQLNAAIARDDIPAHYVPYTRALLAAFRAGARAPVTTYRGSYAMTPALFGAFRVNHAQRLPKFVSTAQNRDAAFGALYTLIFEVPLGCTSALAVARLSEYPVEEEVLLAPYSVVRCIGKQKSPKGVAINTGRGGGLPSRLSEYADRHCLAYVCVRLLRKESSTAGWVGWLSTQWIGGEGGERWAACWAI